MMVLERHDHKNRDGHEEFDIHWETPSPDAGMITTVLRAKNESRSLPWVLPGLLRIADRVIIVDNASDDGTPEVARRVADENNAAHKLDVFDYPFNVARCGPEHLAVPADSVHSLTYFYNWSFSHVTTRYAMKWDGDMVLTEDGERYLKQLRWQLEGVDALVKIPRYAVYIESEDVAYLDAGHENLEPWLWPNAPAFYFGKAFEWEVLVRPEGMNVLTLPLWSLFELKWLDLDEFTNWTDTEFDAPIRTGRKNREWAVYHAVQRGEMPEDVYRIESPGHKHVIQLLREPASARYLIEHQERAATKSL
jgi:glycosyltransferase involved in cell wall biosynthesis